MNKLKTIPFCLMLSSCIYPLKTNNDGILTNIYYSKIQNALLCKLIDVWKFENDYHKRPLAKDGTLWYVEMDIIHTKGGTFGSTNSATKTNRVGSNWAQVITGGLSPSASSSYKLTAATTNSIPNDIFTKKSIKYARSSEDLVMKSNVERDCFEENYVNLSQIKLVPRMKNYILSFDPEGEKGERRYSNFEYKEAGKFVASVGGTYTYSLIPYSAIIPPIFSYTDDFSIQINIARKPLVSKGAGPLAVDIKNPKLGVTITNEVVVIEGKVDINNVRELACRIKFPAVDDQENYEKCMPKTLSLDKASLRKAGDKKRALQVKNKGKDTQPARRILRDRETGNVFQSDPDREISNRRLLEAIEDLR